MTFFHSIYSRGIKPFSLFITIVTILVLSYTVGKYALNIPFADDFAFVDFIYQTHFYKDASQYIDYVSRLHNEHAIIIPRLLCHLDYLVFGDLNFFRLILYANLILFIIFLLLIRYNPSSWGLAALIIFVPNYALNTWAITGIHHLSIELYALLSIIFILKKESIAFFIGGIIASIFGMATHAAGFFILPCILLFIYFSKRSNKNIKFAILFIISSISFYLFLRGYKSPDHHPHIIPHSIGDVLSFFQHNLTLYGNIFYFFSPHPIWTPIFGAMGYMFTVVLISLNWKYLIQRPWQLSVISFVLLNGILISLSRYGFGWIQATSPRYRIIPSILFVVLISIFIERYYKKPIFAKIVAALFTLFILNYTMGCIRGISHIQVHHTSLKHSAILHDIGEPNDYIYPDLKSTEIWLKRAAEKDIYHLPSFNSNYQFKFSDREILIKSPKVRTNWDSINEKKKTTYIKGFSILLGTKSNTLDYYITLTSNDGINYYFDSSQSIRTDVNNAFIDGTNYNWSGFTNLLIKKYSNLPNGAYTLGITLIKRSSMERYYDTENTYIMINNDSIKASPANTGTALCIDAYNSIGINNNTDKIDLNIINGDLVLKGWAFDDVLGLPAKRIIAKVNNHPLIISNFTQLRPDVSKAYANDKLDTVGFQITIPRSWLNKDENEIELELENSNGIILSDTREFLINKN